MTQLTRLSLLPLFLPALAFVQLFAGDGPATMQLPDWDTPEQSTLTLPGSPALPGEPPAPPAGTPPPSAFPLPPAGTVELPPPPLQVPETKQKPAESVRASAERAPVPATEVAKPATPPGNTPAGAPATEPLPKTPEAPKAPKREADHKPGKPPVMFTLNLIGSRPGEMYAALTVLNSRGVPVPGLENKPVGGSVVFPLSPGVYSFVVSAGARVQPSTRVFEVSQEAALLNMPLADYAPVWQAGWKLACLWFSASRAAQGGTSYSRVDEVALAGRARGIETLACDGLWNLRTAAGGTYLESGNGKELLASALAAVAENGTLVVPSWSVRRPGAGAIVALEPAVVVGPEEDVPANVLYPGLETIRQRGGLSVFCQPSGASGGGQPAGEFLFDTVAGPLYDLIDVSRGGDDLNLWWTVLNLGFRVPACGGANAAFLAGAAQERPALGTYLLLPRSRPTPQMFLSVLRSGQSVVSNGPFLRLFVQRPEFLPEQTEGDDTPASGEITSGHFAPIASVTRLSARRRQVLLEAYACSDPADSIRRIELIFNGEVIRTVNMPRPGQRSVQSRWNDIILDRPGWVIARYSSHAEHLWAVTNPVYIRDEASRLPQPAGANCTVSVLSSATGKPVTALVEATNFGSAIGRWHTSSAPLALTLPATARLRVSAPGYEPATAGIYEEGGAGRYAEELLRTNRLAAVLQSADAYEQIRKKLAASVLTFRLEPSRP